MVAVPDSPRGSGNQPSQAPGDAVLVPGAVLGEGFQGFPGGGLLQSQDRLGDSVFLDVQRHGGNPLGEAVEAAAGEGPSEGLQQGLPDGPGEFSLGHDASPVSGQLGLSPPGKFRPGDATFQYGTPAQLLWSFSWKLLRSTPVHRSIHGRALVVQSDNRSAAPAGRSPSGSGTTAPPRTAACTTARSPRQTAARSARWSGPHRSRPANFLVE